MQIDKSSAVLWAVCAVFWCAAGYWFFQFPPSLSSDDALYFSRALTRYSILDFSPHFPGYPVFVALGRLMHGVVADPIQALQSTTIAIALAIPPVAAWVVWRWSRSHLRAGVAFLLALTQPVFAALALSGLSDGAGVLFYLLFLGVLPGLPGSPDAPDRGHGAFLAGIMLGLAFWARPSYAVIFAASVVPILRHPRQLAALIAGSVAVSIPAFAVIFAHEGVGYFGEGLRFLTGHFFHWGNTALSETPTRLGWIESLRATPGLLPLLCVYLCVAAAALRARPDLPRRAAIAGFFAGTIWTAFMQNPENLRHLAPILFVGCLLAASLKATRKCWAPISVAVVALQIGVIAQSHDPNPRCAPAQSLAEALDEKPGHTVLITNRLVPLLRSQLEHARVVDASRTGSIALLKNQNSPPGLWRMKIDAGSDHIGAVQFQRRFPGEQTLRLIPETN